MGRTIKLYIPRVIIALAVYRRSNDDSCAVETASTFAHFWGNILFSVIWYLLY
jgi:hypothetical protein